MSVTLKQVKVAASDLPASQRAELAQYLLDSLGEHDDEEVRAEWIALAEQRMDEVRAGKVIGIPAEQVLKSLLAPGE